VYRLTPEQFRQELRRSIGLLSDLTGTAVVSHRAPFFSITKESLWALDILAESGIRYDSSIFPVRNYRYGIPDAARTPWRHRAGADGELVEFPVSTVRLFGENVPVSGGAYFRIYPYRFSRWLMNRVNQSGWPMVFYIHPWELDPSQPKLPLPLRIRATHYHNLHRTEERLGRLLKDFSFGTLQEVVGDLERRGMVSSC
jgi:polysaccharide deacetylase family protein (PEP-CTERM system associated)